MRTVLKIFMRDLKRVATNPVAVVVTLGVALIPALYAWFNILANWDPYQNTSQMPVAVATLDKGAEVKGMGDVNVGDEVVAKLKDNHKLGWRFVSADEAKQGVESGEYYAAIVLPEDFSADLAGVMDGRLDRPRLEYYVNEKLNPVAPKVTDTGASTVEQTIDQEFVSTVSGVVAEKTGTVAGEVTADANAATQGAADKVRAARDDVNALSGDLKRAQGTCSAARTTVASAGDALDELEKAADGADKTLAGALQTLGETRSKGRTLSADLSEALTSGAADMNGLSATVSADIGALAGDAAQAQATLDATVTRLQAAQDDLQAAKDAATAAANAMPTDTEEQRRAKEALLNQAGRLQGLLDQQQALLDRLKAASTSAGDAAASAKTGAESAGAAASDAAQALVCAQKTIGTEALPKLDGSLDSLASAGGDLRASLSAVKPLVTSARGTLASVDDALVEASDALGHTAETLSSTASSLDAGARDLAAVQGAEAFKALSSVESMDAQAVSDFMGSPVEIKAESLYPVANYGSGVAPFYTNLALFVGGFVLVSIYKLEVDGDDLGKGTGPIKPWQGYFGRWLLLACVGLLQALVTCLGDLALGIQCASPAAFVLAGVVESLVYVNIVYALAVAFKHVGKALAVLLVILQIPGSSGLYPIQMQPPFFRAIYPWLPFTYGNNAMREAVAGFYGANYWTDLAVLLLFIAPALLVGVALRRWLLNVNGLFDRELRATGLMLCERDGGPTATFRLTTLVRAALDSEDYRRDFEHRVTDFARRYPLLVQTGFIALAASPLVLLAARIWPDAKLGLLVAWVALVVALVGLLLAVEYLHGRLAEKCDLSQLPPARLRDLLRERLGRAAAPDGLEVEVPVELPEDATTELGDKRAPEDGDGLSESLEEVAGLTAPIGHAALFADKGTGDMAELLSAREASGAADGTPAGEDDPAARDDAAKGGDGR